MSRRTKFYSAALIAIFLLVIFRAEIRNWYYMWVGDRMASCAAIYAVVEPSITGKTLEFIIFFNPIDDSEGQLATKIEIFHGLATESYIQAGEPSQYASVLTDFTIMDEIELLAESKKNLQGANDKIESSKENCDGILEELQKQISHS